MKCVAAQTRHDSSTGPRRMLGDWGCYILEGSRDTGR